MPRLAENNGNKPRSYVKQPTDKRKDAEARKMRMTIGARERINTGMMIKKLQDHIEDAEKNPILQTQLTAARILLNKTIPDLTSVTLDVSNEKINRMEHLEEARKFAAGPVLATTEGETVANG